MKKKKERPLNKKEENVISRHQNPKKEYFNGEQAELKYKELYLKIKGLASVAILASTYITIKIIDNSQPPWIIVIALVSLIIVIALALYFGNNKLEVK